MTLTIHIFLNNRIGIPLNMDTINQTYDFWWNESNFITPTLQYSSFPVFLLCLLNPL